MIIIAKNSNVTVTPRKLQLLAESIKTMKPADAVEQLSYLNYSGANPLLKTIKQAIANAVNNFKVSEETLRFHSIYVGKGIVYKRGRPGPRGRFKPYEKTRSHITVELLAPTAPKVIKTTPKAKVETKVEEVKTNPKKEVTKTTKKITKKE